jgi:ribosomal protein S21
MDVSPTSATTRLCRNHECRAPLPESYRSPFCSVSCNAAAKARKAERGRITDSTVVHPSDYPSLDRALSALKKACARAGINELAKRHAEFVPKSERLRTKRKRARKRRVE